MNRRPLLISPFTKPLIMARNRSVTVSAVALFLFFALASASVPIDQTGNNGVRTLHGSTDLLESEPETTNSLLLPSDPEPDTVVEIEPRVPDLTQPEDANSNDDVRVPSLEAKTVPLTVVRLRPINRHYFPRRPIFFRRHRRGCYQEGPKIHRPWGPGEQLSYGNDMVLGGAGGEKMMGGGEKQREEGRFRSVGEPRFWMVRPRNGGEKEDDDQMRMHRPHHHHFHHHEDFEHRPDEMDRNHHHDHDRHHEDFEHRPDEMDRDHHHDHDRHHEDFEQRPDEMDRDHHHHHDHDRRHHHEREEEGMEDMEGRGIFSGIRKFLDHF